MLLWVTYSSEYGQSGAMTVIFSDYERVHVQTGILDILANTLTILWPHGWYVVGCICALVFVISGDAGPLLLSPCNTHDNPVPTHSLAPPTHTYTSSVAPTPVLHMLTKQATSRDCGDSYF